MCHAHYMRQRRGSDMLKPLRNSPGIYQGVECKHGDCQRPAASNGLCSAHAGQQRNGRPLGPIKARAFRRAPAGQGCSAPGCDQPYHCSGLCKRHYLRHRAGWPLDLQTEQRGSELPEWWAWGRRMQHTLRTSHRHYKTAGNQWYRWANIRAGTARGRKSSESRPPIPVADWHRFSVKGVGDAVRAFKRSRHSQWYSWAIRKTTQAINRECRRDNLQSTVGPSREPEPSVRLDRPGVDARNGGSGSRDTAFAGRGSRNREPAGIAS